MIKVTIDSAATLRALKNGGKQVRFATAVALTKTAKEVEKAVHEEFKQQFDRPTPMVLKSMRTKPATKNDLTARVFMKDSAIGGKNRNSMAEILGHHFTGGARIKKRLEEVLRQNNFLTGNEFVVPGQAAKLDRYGNMSRGQIVQILSQLRVKGSGYDSTPTTSKRSRRNVAKAGRIFWSWGPSSKRVPLIDRATGIEYGYKAGSASRLPKGAWVANGQSVRPLLIAVSGAPTYRRRIFLDRIAGRIVKARFQANFDAAYRQAMATAR